MRVNLDRLQAKRKAEQVLREKVLRKARAARGRAIVSAARARPPSQPSAVMAAVGNVVASVPKSPRLRNRRLLDLADGRECLLRSPICNHDWSTTVACHGAGVALGKGMGYKLSDFWTVWGCSACNHYTDAYKDATLEQKIAVFTIGMTRQIGAWRAIAQSTPIPAADRRAAQWALDHHARIEKESSHV